jgi:hypothetical protein
VEVYTHALIYFPVNIHMLVTLRVYVSVFVRQLCSGYEHVLYEPPRWKPGWRFTDVVKFVKSDDFARDILEVFCRTISLHQANLIPAVNRQPGLHRGNSYSRCLLPEFSSFDFVIAHTRENTCLCAHMFTCTCEVAHERKWTRVCAHTCAYPLIRRKTCLTHISYCVLKMLPMHFATLSSIQQKPRRANSCVIYTRDLLQYIFFDRIYIYMCRLYVCTRVCSVKHVFKKFWRHIMFVWRTSLILWTNIDWVDYMLWNSDDVVKDVAYFYIFRESDNFVRDILN